MATTSSTENMFPSSSSATSSVSAGTSGSSGMGGSGSSDTGSGLGSSGMSGSGIGSSGLGGSSLGGSMDTGMGSSTTTRPQSDVLSRVVQGAHSAIDKLADTVAPHVQRLEQGVGSASETLHLRADHAREVGDEWAENLRSTVRENPLAAVGIALAVGLLVSRLTR